MAVRPTDHARRLSRNVLRRRPRSSHRCEGFVRSIGDMGQRDVVQLACDLVPLILQRNRPLRTLELDELLGLLVGVDNWADSSNSHASSTCGAVSDTVPQLTRTHGATVLTLATAANTKTTGNSNASTRYTTAASKDPIVLVTKAISGHLGTNTRGAATIALLAATSAHELPPDSIKAGTTAAANAARAAAFATG